MGKITFASVISEIQQSDVFMTVKARICEAPQANLNGARVTEAFIDEIVSNEARYVGLPLYADKKALISGNYTRLGHLYDTKTGEFHSTQIGSFYKFEKQTTQNGCALIGYARIPKRNKKLSKAISELFADNALKFSFELSVGEYEELEDDTILIDASENNYLEGTAIVTYPACEEAVALELVAQKADDSRKGESEMAEVENKAEVVETEAAQPVVAEEVTDNVTETPENITENVTAEEETACKDKKENSEEETEEETACKKRQAEEEPAENTAETAAVVMHEIHEERHTQVAYDTETGKEVSQTVSIETCTCDVAEGNLVETVDGVHVAEAGGEGGDTPAETPAETTAETPAETPTETPAEAPAEAPAETPATRDANDADEDVGVVEVEQKKTAEQMIAELMDVIKELQSEIAELKEEKKATTMVAEINPFISDITANKYSLLEKAQVNTNSYSLLEKY